MIDPRGHRFGAGVSALLLVGAFLTGTAWLVAIVLVSIGVSAAFGLRFSIYGAIPASAGQPRRRDRGRLFQFRATG